jgi:repressor LexA
MRTVLTSRQQAIYDYVIEFTHNRGFPPTIREIGIKFSIAAPSVLSHLRALEKKGVIRREPFKPRCIEVLRKT